MFRHSINLNNRNLTLIRQTKIRINSVFLSGSKFETKQIDPYNSIISLSHKQFIQTNINQLAKLFTSTGSNWINISIKSTAIAPKFCKPKPLINQQVEVPRFYLTGTNWITSTSIAPHFRKSKPNTIQQKQDNNGFP